MEDDFLDDFDPESNLAYQYSLGSIASKARDMCEASDKYTKAIFVNVALALANVLLSVGAHHHELGDLRDDERYGADRDAEIIIKTHRGQRAPRAASWTEQKIEATIQCGLRASRNCPLPDPSGGEAGRA
jgi:hypothetical protein